MEDSSVFKRCQVLKILDFFFYLFIISFSQWLISYLWGSGWTKDHTPPDISLSLPLVFMIVQWIQTWPRSASFTKFGYCCVAPSFKIHLDSDYNNAQNFISNHWILDFVSQMSSIETAIDRRISESRLAGRMAF